MSLLTKKKMRDLNLLLVEFNENEDGLLRGIDNQDFYHEALAVYDELHPLYQTYLLDLEAEFTSILERVNPLLDICIGNDWENVEGPEGESILDTLVDDLSDLVLIRDDIKRLVRSPHSVSYYQES